MRDSQYIGRMDRDEIGVSFLAKTVMERLAARDAVGECQLAQSILTVLTEAMTNPNPAAFDALKPLLKKARVTATDLADHYFPEIARRLGCDWAEDRKSFADVSIGVARMQSVLRDVGADWASEDSERPRIGTVLLILPEGEQHSFGAMVLAGQLRRRGVSVRLLLGPSPADLRDLLAERGFDGAMLSIGCIAKLEPCRKLVKALRDGTGGALRVLVGGAVLAEYVDARAVTGADFATNDLTEALLALGLAGKGALVG